jgi:cell pole-organizing protein PopZ
VSLEPDKPASASAEAATTDDVPKPADQLPPAEAGAPAPGSGEPPAESHSPSAEDILQSIAAGLAVESPAGTGETAPAPVFESPPTAAVQAQAWSGDEGLSSSPVPETPTQQMEMIPVSGEGLKKPELVSEETVAASTAALAQLAQTVGRTKEASAGPSQTVDELVRGAVEPMLKQWLDANLSRIVERMVREAIEKVVRRVE